MARNLPKTRPESRTARTRREVAYQAGRGWRTALRAIQARLGNATACSLGGTPVLVVGLAIMAHSCTLWNHSHLAGSESVFGGIYAAAGLGLFYAHGEIKRRNDHRD